MNDEQTRDYVAALIRERETCEQRGLTDRVNEINKQLRVYGESGRTPRDRAEKRLVKPSETR